MTREKEQVVIIEVSRKRLVSDSAWSVITAIFNSAFALAYLIVVGNYWESSGLGVFALCASLYLIGSLLFNVGIHSAVLYEVAASGEDKKRASAFAYTALFSSLILGLSGGIICFISAPLIAAAYHQPLMTGMMKLFSLAMPLFLINKTATGILNAHRRMQLIAAVNIIRGALILFYMLGTAILKTGFVTIPYGFILAESLIAVLLLAACVRTHKPAAPSLQRAKQLISFGWKTALSGVIGDINARLDILVIGIFWDSTIVGMYTVASALGKGLWLIPGAIQKVTNPLIVQLYSTDQKDKLHRTMDVLIRLGTALFIVISLIIVIYIKPLIRLCYPQQLDMLGAAAPLYFLLPGVAIFSSIAMLGSAPSTSIGRPENALKLIFTVFSVNLLMNFVLVPSFAAAGAAVATTISLLLAFIYFTWLCKKYLDFTVPLTRLLSLFAVLSLLIVSAVVFESIVHHFIMLAAGLIIIIGAVILLRIVRKSDAALIRSILKSFSKSEKQPVA